MKKLECLFVSSTVSIHNKLHYVFVSNDQMGFEIYVNLGFTNFYKALRNYSFKNNWGPAIVEI